VLKQIDETETTFVVSLGGDLVSERRAVLKKGWLSFVSGLLLRTLGAPTNKVELRRAVLSHLGMLPEGCSKGDLPKALQDRAEAAKQMKITCSN